MAMLYYVCLYYILAVGRGYSGMGMALTTRPLPRPSAEVVYG